jgi:uncharacterized protein (TIRG00374 family)
VTRLWKTGLRIVLCAALLAWIFHCIFVNEARLTHGTDWEQLSRGARWQLGWQEGPARLWETLRLIQPGWFALSLVLMAATILLGVIRWRMVLSVQGLELPFLRAVEISLVAHFFNSFLLGSTGGDLMKAYYAARETHHRKTEAAVTVFVDRLIGFWAMLLFAAMMIAPNVHELTRSRPQLLACLLILGMVLGCSIIALLAFRGGVSRRWTGARVWLRRLPKGASLERSLDSCRLYGKHPLFLTRTVLFSMLLNLVCVWQWQAVGQGLGFPSRPVLMTAVVPMVICIAALPITPSGLGVRETLFVELLNDPPTATQALSLSLLAYAGSLFWSLCGGLVYLLFREKHHLAEIKQAAPASEGE